MSVLFLDGCGAPFDGDTPNVKGLGGSELAQIQLAEALTQAGATVKVMVMRDENPEPRTIRGVTYGHSDLSDVKTVVLSRLTPCPAPLQSRRIIVSLTDMGPHETAKCDILVGVSRWQLSRFPGRAQGQHVKCIPPIVEHVPDVAKVPGRFVYCSGRAKGLDTTLEMWRRLRPTLPPHAHLRVTTAGWDLPKEGSVEAVGAEWLGVLTPPQIRQEIASAQGLFYVNTYPETFCAVAAVAEASGTVPVIACLNGAGGLPEAISAPLCRDPAAFAAKVQDVLAGRVGHLAPKNYSPQRIARAWLQIL